MTGHGISGYTQELARFIVDFDQKSLPDAVAHQATIHMLDSFSNAVFGSTLPWGKRIISSIERMSSGGNSRVWGQGPYLEADKAAMVNGSLVHSFEMDDLHVDAFLHPGAVVVPAAFAAVQLVGRPVTGAELLTAIALGYEISIRVGLMAGLGLLRRGWHNTPAVGPFGACVAAGRLLGLNETQQNWALGTAATQAGGLVAAQYGADVKRWHAGRAAQSGLYAAFLSSENYSGISDVFDVQHGGYPATLTDDFNRAELSQGLGDSWAMLNTRIKEFPSSASCYTAIETALYLRHEMGLQPDLIEQVAVSCSSASLEHVGWEYRPSTVTGAQMNLQYCMASALLHGSFTPDLFDSQRLGDPQVLELIDRITLTPDDEFDAGGRAKRHSLRTVVTTKDGRLLKKDLLEGSESLAGPLSTETVVRKSARSLQSRYTAEEADTLIAAILGIVNSGDCYEDLLDLI
jgi:aconitate decarboxylase